MEYIEKELKFENNTFDTSPRLIKVVGLLLLILIGLPIGWLAWMGYQEKGFTTMIFSFGLVVLFIFTFSIRYILNAKTGKVIKVKETFFDNQNMLFQITDTNNQTFYIPYHEILQIKIKKQQQSYHQRNHPIPKYIVYIEKEDGGFWDVYISSSKSESEKVLKSLLEKVQPSSHIRQNKIPPLPGKVKEKSPNAYLWEIGVSTFSITLSAILLLDFMVLFYLLVFHYFDNNATVLYIVFFLGMLLISYLVVKSLQTTQQQFKLEFSKEIISLSQKNFFQPNWIPKTIQMQPDLNCSFSYSLLYNANHKGSVLLLMQDKFKDKLITPNENFILSRVYQLLKMEKEGIIVVPIIGLSAIEMLKIERIWKNLISNRM